MKKYKYLFANGCSFVVGTGTGTLDVKGNNKFVSMEHRFSKLLSDKIGSTEINMARGGSSNNRIVRSTYEWAKENHDKCKDTLVVLGTSQFYRDIEEGYGKWPEFVEQSSEIRRNIIEKLEMKKQTISLELLIYYLKSHGCDVIYFNSFDNFNLGCTQFQFDENLSWRDWLIKTQGEPKYIGYRSSKSSPDGWYGMDGLHPGWKAHSWLSEKIINFLGEQNG